jgi:hypothetical protein
VINFVNRKREECSILNEAERLPVWVVRVGFTLGPLSSRDPSQRTCGRQADFISKVRKRKSLLPRPTSGLRWKLMSAAQQPRLSARASWGMRSSSDDASQPCQKMTSASIDIEGALCSRGVTEIAQSENWLRNLSGYAMERSGRASSEATASRSLFAVDLEAGVFQY